MSLQLTNSKVQEFEKEVKQSYQQENEILVNAASAAGALVKRNLVGESTSFPRMTKAFMVDKGASQTNIAPANVKHFRIPLLLQNKVLLEYTDIFDQAEVNYDEQAELAKLFGKALARDKDQSVIEALEAGSYSATPVGEQGLGIDIGGTTAMSVDKLKKAAAYFNKLGVPQSDRVLALDAESHEQLMNDDEFINGDYNAIKALNNGGMVDTYVGFKIILLPDCSDDDGVKQNGLPKTGDIRKIYAFHGASIGIAYGDVLDDITIAWENEKASYSCLAKLRRGSVIRDNQGVIEIENDVSL